MSNKRGHEILVSDCEDMIASILKILENSPIDELEKKLETAKIEINGDIFKQLEEAMNFTECQYFEGVEQNIQEITHIVNK